MAPASFVDALLTLCRESGVWLVSDEAYKEITFDGTLAYSPPALSGVIRIYTMSKVYGMAGWRVGAILYPKELSIHLRKVNDTIPTHATILSQVVAFHALKEDALYIPKRVDIFSAVRDVFVQACREVYTQLGVKFVTGNSAFYLFLPIETRDRNSSDVASFLVKAGNVLVVPGHAFGMKHYIRVSYGSVCISDASSAAGALRKGLSAWFNLDKANLEC